MHVVLVDPGFVSDVACDGLNARARSLLLELSITCHWLITATFLPETQISTCLVGPVSAPISLPEALNQVADLENETKTHWYKCCTETKLGLSLVDSWTISDVDLEGLKAPRRVLRIVPAPAYLPEA